MDSLVFFLVVAASLVVTNAYAFLRNRDTDFETYTSDKNSHGLISIALSVTGTIVGGGMFLGVGQIGFEAGVVGFLVGVAYFVSLTLAAYMAPRLRELMDEQDSGTLLDLIARMLSPRVAQSFAVASLTICVFLVAGQFVALYSFATFASTLSPSWIPWLLVCLGIASIAMYAVLGGLRKDILSDAVQVVVICLAMAILCYRILTPSTVESSFHALPASHFSGFGYGSLFLAGISLFVPPLFLVRMDMWQRIRSASTASAARGAFFVAAGASLVSYVLFATLGMIAKAEGGHSASNATLEMIRGRVTVPLELGLVIGGLFAAVLSSADTFINNASIFGASLFMKNRRWEAAGIDKMVGVRALRLERIVAAAVTAMALLLGWWKPDLVDLMVGALSLLLVYLMPVLGLVIPGLRNEKAAYYSSNVGVAVFALCFLFWNPKLAFVPAVLLAIVLYLVILGRLSRGNGSVQSATPV